MPIVLETIQAATVLLATQSVSGAGPVAHHETLAPVINVVPVHHAQSFPQTSYVCRQDAVPVYRGAPITSVTHQRNSGFDALGVLIGAAVGGAVVSKSERLAGALVGGAVGHVVTSQPSTITTVHGYTPEFVGYRDIQKCEVVHGSYEKNVVIGYNVTYSVNGALKTITVAEHPGTHLRLR